jgi:hypothetical protein
MKSPTIAMAGMLAAAACGCASAATLMDQIGSNGSFQQGLSNASTQISNFYASAPQYNITVTDDFSLTGKAVLSGVDAALFATNGFGQLTALRVNIFDTQPTAANYAAGNLFSVDVQVANIGFTSPWTTDPLTRLAAIDLSGYGLTLDAGTYWLSVVAQNNSFSSDIGIFMSSFAGTPGNDNARQVGSGLWGGGGDRALNADAAYRITGTFAAPVPSVPEPETYALMLAGLGVLGAVARRRSR